FHARHVRPVHHRDATQPLDADIALPARHDEAQGVAVLRAHCLTVLTIGDQHVVHHLRHGQTALVASSVGALGDDPGRTLLHTSLAQRKPEWHAGPLTAARQAVRTPNALPPPWQGGARWRRTPLRPRVARTLEEENARDGGQAPDLLHSQDCRTIDHAMDEEA